MYIGSNKKIYILIFILFITFSKAFSQQSRIDSIEDSQSVDANSELSLAEITVLLSKSETDIIRILADLPSFERLNNLKLKNDSLIDEISVNLREYNSEDANEKSRRNIENDIKYWKIKRKILGEEINAISNFIDNDLDNKVLSLRDKSKEIEKLFDGYSDEELSTSLTRKRKLLRDNINKSLRRVIDIRNKAIEILDYTNELDERIGISILQLEESNYSLMMSLLNSKFISIFEIQYNNDEIWAFDRSFRNSVLRELNGLKEYFFRNKNAPIFELFYILVLVYMFLALKKNYLEFGSPGASTSVYKKHFYIILQNPVSSAILIGLTSSLPFYANFPLIFYDINRLLLIFPLIFIINKLPSKDYRDYVYAYLLVVFIHLFYIFFPKESIYSRYSLILMAIIEFAASIIFIRQYIRSKGKKVKTWLENLIIKFLIFQVLITGLAIVGSIVGYVDLTEFFVKLAYSLTVMTFLLAVFLIAVNGGIIFYLESEKSAKFRSLKKNSSKLIRVVTTYSTIVTLLLLVIFIHNLLEIEQSVYDSLIGWIKANRTIGEMSFSYAGLFTFLLVIYLSMIVSKIIKVVLEEDVFARVNVESGLSNSISTVIRYAIITIGVIIALKSAGLHLNEFTIILSAFGVGIGFGLQNIFNNFVSGFILLFERPIKIGDTIEVGTLIGVVKKIGIRSSNIRTFDGAEIIVPNGNLISNEVINWTLSDQMRRVEILVGVSYDSNPHQVYEVLMETLLNHPDIEIDPSPNVYFVNFGDNSLDFRVLFWTKHYDSWYPLRSEISYKIFDALKAANISIPYPQRDLHLKSIDKSFFEKGNKNPLSKEMEDIKDKKEHKDYGAKSSQNDSAMDDD